jgi:hypothetical protein
MFNLDEFRVDTERQNNGVWIDFGGGAKFKLASLQSKGFTDEFRSKTKPYTDVDREIPEEEQEQIMVTCLAKHVVLGWKNVFDGDQEFHYSEDNAVKLLTELSAVRNMIIAEAKKLQNFKAKAKEAVKKS